MGEAPVLETAARSSRQSGVILTYLAETTGKFAPGNDERALRSAALDAVRQPQVHELSRHLPLPQGVRAAGP